jgi:hypothetical protein
MRIGDVPMKCKRCGFECRLDDANGDDQTEEGDGHFGCPQPDCGGVMLEIPRLKKP